MKVSVTKEHIRAGRRGDPAGCPVYLALRNAGVKARCVTSCSIWLVKGGDHQLTRRASTFIRRFDTRKPVKPFSFVLKEK